MKPPEKFVILWKPAAAYVRNTRGKQPYTTSLDQAKCWKTHKAAQRFLDLKDPAWASNCVIVQVIL